MAGLCKNYSVKIEIFKNLKTFEIIFFKKTRVNFKIFLSKQNLKIQSNTSYKNWRSENRSILLKTERFVILPLRRFWHFPLSAPKAEINAHQLLRLE
jgi:hypothetical protein